MTDTSRRDALPETLKGPPSGYFIVMSPSGQRDPIDVGALIGVVLSSWLLLAGAALLGGIVAAVIAFQLPQKFRAQALVSPVTQGSGGAGALRNQFGGIAALAGINLGSGGGRNEEALATFDSNGFARDFIVNEKLLPILFPERWDSTQRAWKASEGGPPTLEAAVNKFAGDVRTISQDRQTGLVTVTVEWVSPTLAAQWANRLVEVVNERLRSEATRSAERSIEYLNQELAKTSVVDLRQAIYRLIQDQVNNAMLANVQREYAFRVIDPAVAPVTRASPKRTLLTAAGLFAGFFCGLLFVLLRHFRRLRKVAGGPRN
jgi:uncharacterized protein involved in exopolysaccharide biosynthesis